MGSAAQFAIALTAFCALPVYAFSPAVVARPQSLLYGGFGAAPTKTKAVQIKPGAKTMDKHWDQYFTIKDKAGSTINEVWITTPGGEKPLPLGFVAAKAGGSVAEAVALQKKLILWCAEGLHPKLAPALRGKVKGEFELELAFCEIAPLSDEELLKEEEAGDAVVDGKPPGGPLTGLGTTRAPPELSPKDVGFMPFKSPIEAGQAAMRAPSKRERSNGTVG
mmetsp:Transcript_10497/g.31348  ORF Transcript_10497/g.31348 Transcript_10497/m.31348 type:complete len:221 (+) Transcript_10497:160-822(+)